MQKSIELDLTNILIFLFVFFLMEFVAWFTHKYVMHGFLWYFHKDHHTRDNKGVLKKRFLLFNLCDTGFFFMMYGIHIGIVYFPFWIGLGITVYGAAYFLHDLFIHQRLKVLKNTKNKFIRH